MTNKSENVVLKEFSSMLDELTFNSGPIIASLAKFSEEHIEYSQQIVELVEKKITKSVPKQKLYAIYVLDSICKNVGSPYTIYFSRNLAKLFKSTYLIVDNKTRQSLINTFKTWVIPPNTGGTNDPTSNTYPLFDQDVLKNIENFLIRASALHERQIKMVTPKPTIPLLLKEIDRLIMICNNIVNITANNGSATQVEKTNAKIILLQELRQELLKRELPQEALKQVQDQLTQNFVKEQKYSLQLQQQQQQQQKLVNISPPSSQLQQFPLSQANKNILFSNSSIPINNGANINAPAVINNTSDEFSNNGIFGMSQNPLFPSTNTTANNNISSTIPNASKATDTINISRTSPEEFIHQLQENKINNLQKLYNSLKENDLLYIPGKESIVGLCNNYLSSNSIDSIDLIKNLPPLELLNNLVQDSISIKLDLNAFINSSNFQLNNWTINNTNIDTNISIKNDNNYVQFLYRYKPCKCSMCGKRYVTKSTELNEHLDWHFRINKKLKNNRNKVLQSRNWYLNDDEWIHTPNSNNNDTDAIVFNDNSVSNGGMNEYNNHANVNHRLFDKNLTGNLSIHGLAQENPNPFSFTRINDTAAAAATSSNSDNNNNNNSRKRSFDHNTNIRDNDFITPLHNVNNKKHRPDKIQDINLMFEVIPDSSNSMEIECYMCKDVIQGIYNEDEGQWVWPNCIKTDDGNYCHATCYYEIQQNQ
ncbi:uncharacterized protein SCODWIG_02259 [Saccharomycodes ludwigii]|uniref:CID domain-containing protein n=1 Tax=Saccharomycodes ludwigii TaxID=36035 RepID=A0A376B754_9ASCO|nr:hypothetical protein SCDLUD_001915 [Saccharomycodes ludwigii]KAH3902102.1 hypothetical protein SCDLUD_001915 [Saccharomycodes ludwigii]SSD60498.1 uncharacterized protein SCODWIG_02259 [Saccharomycodes ludwigii]